MSGILASLPMMCIGKSCLQQRRTAVYMSLRNGLILVGILLGLTPILRHHIESCMIQVTYFLLRSLTQAFSDDTILFLSIVCLMLHVLSQDYAFINNYHDRCHFALPAVS